MRQVNYTIGFMKDGTVKALKANCYIDGGFAGSTSDAVLTNLFTMIDGCYNIANWELNPFVCRTNLPTNTFCRAPGEVSGAFFAEEFMTHVAAYLDMAAEDVRQANLYAKDDVTPYGQKLPYFNIPEIWSALEESADFAARAAAVASYNTDNRWTKKGIQLMPVKYGVSQSWAGFNVQISILAADGTVQVGIGGIEMGQGINTKVAQVVALELGCTVGVIKIIPTNTFSTPNASTTGGSVGSGINCMAAQAAAQELATRLQVRGWFLLPLLPAPPLPPFVDCLIG